MTDLGKIGYVLKGDYDATASYEYLDVVYYNGSTYAAKKNVTGVAPTTGRSDDLNWQIMVNPAAGLIRPLGTITFAELPESPTSGDSYDISNSFTTDSRFKEGAGKKYPGGVNVYYTADGYWDILAGKPIVSAINGMKIDGTDNVNNYGVCSTAGATVAKTVSITGNFLLVSGAEVDVKFANNNTATAPTLNVNNTGAKPIYYAGDAIEARNIMAGMVYSFRYNGTQWDLVGGVNSGHVIEDEDGTDYSNRTNLVFENAEVTDDPTHDATVVRPNGDKSHVFDTLEEANEALADGLLKDGDVVYIKQGPGEVNISRLEARIGLVENNKQDKTLSSPIGGQTTVEGALGTLNTHFTDIGKRCSTPIQAPTSIGGSVNVTVTDTAHNVWVIKCGLRSGWAIWLLAIGSIRWLTTQTSDGSIEVQGTADNTLAVRYINKAGTSGDTVEVYAIK